jgi:hypothetical protein
MYTAPSGELKERLNRWLLDRAVGSARRPQMDEQVPHGNAGELMEVHGFDLMAQVEAMLRHVRQYQREVQRLRGILGAGQTVTSDKPAIDAVRHHVGGLVNAAEMLVLTLQEIQAIVDGTPAQQRPGRGNDGHDSKRLPKSAKAGRRFGASGLKRRTIKRNK